MFLNEKYVRLMAVFLLLLIIRLSSNIGADICYVILALIAILGGKYTIYAFITSWFFTMINPVIAPNGSLGAIGRFLVVIFGFIPVFFSFIVNQKKIVNLYSIITFLIGFLILFHSFIFSTIPSISILKLFMWLITIITLLSCWSSMGKKEFEEEYEILVKFLKMIIILSLPFLTISFIGFARNGTGFQGLLNHPQAFGPTVAILGSILLSKLVTSKIKSRLDWILLILLFPLIILSEARTAGLALILSLFISLILNGAVNNKNIFGYYVFKNKFTYIFLLTIPFLFYPFKEVILDKLSTYFLKRTDSDSFLEIADNSRGGLVDNMMFNIQNNPFFGIGFGMPSTDEKLLIDYDPFFGIPIGAAIEKGVLPIAVIEELGMILGGLVLIWLLYSIYKCFKLELKFLTVIICLILLNLGEYMFFSVGGMGMLILIMYTASVSSASRSD